MTQQHSKRFKQLRETQHISANKLAQKTGVSAATITRFEKDETDIKLKTVSKLMDALGLSLSDLEHTSRAKKLYIWENAPHYTSTHHTFLYHYDQNATAHNAFLYKNRLYIINTDKTPKEGDLSLFITQNVARVEHYTPHHQSVCEGVVIQHFEYYRAQES